MGVLSVVDAQVERFVESNPLFEQTCLECFEQCAESRDVISFEEAIDMTDAVLSQLGPPLTKYGIMLEKVTRKEMERLYLACDHELDDELDLERFQDHYARVTKYAAIKYSVSFTSTYATGILGGICVITLLRYGLRALPVVGPVIRPALGLLPPFLIGPLVGTAAMKTYEQHELEAARKRFFALCS